MKYGGIVGYLLTYFYEKDRILPGIIEDLDIVSISGILKECGQWHDLLALEILPFKSTFP
jgi:hypothetical protein